MSKLVKTGGGPNESLYDKYNERLSSAISQRGAEAIRHIQDNRDLLLRYLVLRVAQRRSDAGQEEV
ncbi:MAG: hypothetical protein A2218_01760 [Elusimicrobia bacterium RIFOXYA2_FULL_53_38]|nr:MAG: hypothetical protein A2218_01760 [Elusimicrobia bacterium RIFOXYA2_FULL_53_38]